MAEQIRYRGSVKPEKPDASPDAANSERAALPRWLVVGLSILLTLLSFLLAYSTLLGANLHSRFPEPYAWSMVAMFTAVGVFGLAFILGDRKSANFWRNLLVAFLGLVVAALPIVQVGSPLLPQSLGSWVPSVAPSEVEPIRSLIITLAAMIGVTAIVVVVTDTRKLLERLNDKIADQSLTPEQRLSAFRLKQSVADQIHANLTEQFPVELRISRDAKLPITPRRQSRARIKIVIDNGAQPIGGADLSWPVIESVLTDNHIRLQDALILVQDRSGAGRVLCYGTAQEFRWLHNLSGSFLGTTSQNIGKLFFDAINHNDAERVQRAVRLARAEMTRRCVLDDVLLSDVTVYGESTLSDALRALAQGQLRRLLVVARAQPFEQRLLSATEIGEALVADATEA